jgi:hypothetical protein
MQDDEYPCDRCSHGVVKHALKEVIWCTGEAGLHSKSSCASVERGLLGLRPCSCWLYKFQGDGIQPSPPPKQHA